jgi:predicted DNA-binding transcriptional regulator YafY
MAVSQQYDDRMQKAERLMAITLLLQARGKLTAERLADILSVSVRTIYRDMNSLSLAHVPVSMDIGPGGGYFLPDESYVDPVTFTGEEAIALALGGAIAGGSHLFDRGERLRQALIKLEAVLPEEYREDVRSARELILVDISAWYRVPSTPRFFESVRTAVWQRRRLDLRYQRLGSMESEWRRVDPLGLIWKVGVWYLAAYCYARQDFRVFHLNRIQNLNAIEDSIAPRPDFNLESFWEDARRRFEELTAPLVLTLRATPAQLAMSDGRHEVLRKEADGTSVVRISLDSTESAISHVLSLGPGATVLDPPEVRDGVVAAARSIVDSYEEQGSIDKWPAVDTYPRIRHED